MSSQFRITISEMKILQNNQIMYFKNIWRILNNIDQKEHIRQMIYIYEVQIIKDLKS
jgi:hypothetical protein